MLLILKISGDGGYKTFGISCGTFDDAWIENQMENLSEYFFYILNLSNKLFLLYMLMRLNSMETLIE